MTPLEQLEKWVAGENVHNAELGCATRHNASLTRSERGMERTDDPWGDLRAMWEEADKKAKDYRDNGEVKLLEQMHDAWIGLMACGWNEIEYCPKDGTRFLAICAGNTGVFPHYYTGECPNGHWWAEAHGDLWPSRPILYKPLPSNTTGAVFKGEETK